MTRSYAQRCPIAMTLDLIGERWTLLVIRELLFGRTKFKELIEQCPGIPTKILANRLKSLEAHALIERRVYSEHPLRASYHLTARGLSLAPVMEAIVRWGMDHAVEPAERAEIATLIDERVVAAKAPFPLLSKGASRSRHRRRAPLTSG